MNNPVPKELLPELDREFLDEKEFAFDVAPNGGELLVAIRNFGLPAAYEPEKVDLMIIIPAGYPNAQLDMFWTYPDVKRRNGGYPAQCEHHQIYGDRNWQRWSRHFQQPWRPGVDNLRTFMASIRKELAKGI
jgi:hypothetical protein